MAVINFKNHVAVNFFSRTKRWIKLQLSHSQPPQSQARQYFSGLSRPQLRSWSSLIMRCGTNPQHTIASLLPTYTTLAHPPPVALVHAQALVAHLQARIPVPATSDSISASPHLYLLWMWEMLQDIEPLAAAHEPGSKLFSMVPQCGNQTRFITITSTCLHRYAFLCALATKPSAFYRRITDAHHVGTVSTTCQVFYMSSVLDITCIICRLCLMSNILLPHLPCGRS